MKPSADFLGTYFDRESVFRLERWARIVAWGALAVYLVEAGYNTFQNVYGAITGGYPLDWFILLNLSAKIVQGGGVFIVLQIAAKIMLILLDIEDNTRRAARINSKEN